MERVIYTFPRNSDSTYQLVETDELPMEPHGQMRLVLRRINPLGRPTYQSIMAPPQVIELASELARWGGRWGSGR